MNYYSFKERKELGYLEKVAMKRIGVFTGKIYDETVDTLTIKECCVWCENPTELDIQRAKLSCVMCSNKECPNKKEHLK